MVGVVSELESANALKVLRAIGIQKKLGTMGVNVQELSQQRFDEAVRLFTEAEDIQKATDIAAQALQHEHDEAVRVIVSNAQQKMGALDRKLGEWLQNVKTAQIPPVTIGSVPGNEIGNTQV